MDNLRKMLMKSILYVKGKYQYVTSHAFIFFKIYPHIIKTNIKYKFLYKQIVLIYIQHSGNAFVGLRHII